MRSSPPRHRSRFAVAVALGLPAAVLVGLLLFWGGTKTWQLWRIRAAWPPFLDSQVVTSAAESWRQGYDPLIKNPADISGRPLNYPRVWHLAFRLGLAPRHAIWMGATLIALFSASVAGFMLRHRDVSPWWFAAAIFSPAILLGVERGNIDLAMFALIALALAALQAGRRGWATAAILGAGALKLFPFAAIVALVDEKRRSSLTWVAAALGLAALYLISTWHDIGLIRAATPQDTWFAYGWRVLPDGVARLAPEYLKHARLLTVMGFVVSGLVALLGWWRSSRMIESHTGPATNDSVLAAFRAGVGCYAGTFLVGENFRYRMIFLLFALPQLVRWCRTPGWRTPAWLALGAFYVGLWIARWEGGWTTHAEWVAFFFGQAANWILFAVLLWLFAATLPSWLRPDLRPRILARAVARFAIADLAFVALLTVAVWFAGNVSAARTISPTDTEQQLLVAGALFQPPAFSSQRGVDLLEVGPASLAALRPAVSIFPRAPVLAAQWTALLTVSVTALFGYAALRQRYSGWITLLSLVPVLAVFALPAGDFWAWRSSTFLAGLLLLAVSIARLNRPASTSLIPATAALAGAVIGLMPFVSTPGIGLTLVLIPAAFLFAYPDPAERRWFAAGTLFSLAAGFGWLFDRGQSSFLSEHYWSNLLHPTPLAAAIWGRTILTLAGAVAAMLAVHVLAQFLSRAAIGIRIIAALAGVALVVGVPRLGHRPSGPAGFAVIAEHMTNDYGSRDGDQLTIWGEVAGLHALSLRSPGLPWICPARAARSSDRAARARFLEGLRVRAPVYFADTTGADPHQVLPAHENFPELAEFIREYYTLLDVQDGIRLYGLSGYMRARNAARVGAVPLRIETMTRTEAKVAPHYLREFQHTTRIFTHATARFTHPAPPGAVRLRGTFGVLPDAYAKPDGHTDGGTFIIEVTTADGQRHRLFERTLDPFAHEYDRGDQPLDVDLTTVGAIQQVDLIVDPRGGEAFDWMYWGDVNFGVKTTEP